MTDPTMYTTYSDADIMAIQEAAITAVRKYSDAMEKRALKAERLLSLAESFIPLAKRYDYELLANPGSYGGSDPN